MADFASIYAPQALLRKLERTTDERRAFPPPAAFHFSVTPAQAGVHVYNPSTPLDMYAVRMEISATESRKLLFQLFDAADRVDDVRGTVYRLSLAGPRTKAPKAAVTLEWVDRAVERGQWTFEPSSRGGVTFKARK